MKLVSIVIPVYNVEKYLEECLESIKNQTYKNFEALLVDDGSTDSSGTICDRYAIIDERFKVIHKENGGAASARNMALKIAKGEYITFVDSDDYVELNFLHELVTNVDDCDIVQCNEKVVYKNKKINMDTIKSETYNKVEFLEVYLNNWMCSLLHNKLFKRNVINNISFEEGHIVDDEYFTYLCVLQSKKIKQIDNVLYNYRMRKTGVMRNEMTVHRINVDRVDFLYKRYKNIKNINEIKDIYIHDLIDQYLNIMTDYYINEKLINVIKKRLLLIFFQVSDLNRKKSIIVCCLHSARFYMKRRKIKSDEKVGDSLFYE